MIGLTLYFRIRVYSGAASMTLHSVGSVISPLIPGLIARPRRAFHTLVESLPVAIAYRRLGRPEYVLRFDGGIGDDFLCSAVARELRIRGAKNIWMLTEHPGLFLSNRDVTFTAKKGRRGVRRFFEKHQIEPTILSYAPHVNGHDIQPARHVITEMCARMRITGCVTRRPYLHLHPNELATGRFSERQIAIQSSGLSARFAARTKEWFPERFQQVIDHYRGHFTVVQVGSTSDPFLDGAIDLRGKTTIRETAAVLANSKVFVGLAGFLQHLARSVDCRAVIVYGGREKPAQTGYSCNENITERTPCSPCWSYGTCDYRFHCMDAISVDRVVKAIDRQIRQAGLPLSTDQDLCP